MRRALLLSVLVVVPAAVVAQAPSLPANPGIEWRPTAARLIATCDSGIAIGRSAVAAIHAMPIAKRSFANSIGMLERESARMNRVMGAGPQLMYISPDSAVRDASQACNQKATDFAVEVGADPEIYRTAAALQKTGTSNAADRKLLALYVENGRHAGAGLNATTRERTTALFKKLNDVQRDYGIAIAADHSTIHISADEAKGVSPQLLGTLKPDSAGGYTIPVNESTIGLFSRTEPVGAARQRFTDAYFARGGAANIKRLEQAIAMRDTLAHLFGFRNWASYQLDTHMAKDPARVTAFLDRIATNLHDAASKETATLAEMKRESGDPAPIAAADLPYFSAMLRRTKYNLDPEEVRQYFPVDHVMKQVLGIYEELLGVKFTEYAKPDAWFDGVKEYVVTDATSGRPRGWIYFDLYPRPNKYEHFATAPLRTGVHWKAGEPDLPVTMIMGNWPTPEPGKPSLLSHGDVVTFFHEFGHMMAATLVDVPYPTLANLRQDFVEAPSQMLENWMWSPQVLARVSKNVKTGQPLSKELIDRMIALRQLGAASGNSQQAFYAMYDMRLHMTPGLETKATWDSLYTRIVASPLLTGAYPAAAFGHLMGGYDAGYYGYLWSKVYAQDLFTRFEKDGVMNRKSGLAYRTMILEPGGTREPDDLLKAFLGRPLNDDAFYRDLGIATSKPKAAEQQNRKQ